jgi:hypothetical protein
MSTDQLLAVELLARLATVTKANGYASDAGLHVFDGATGVPDNLGTFLVLAESEEGVASQKGQGGKPDDVKVSLPFAVEGRITCNPLHPNAAARQLCADIRRAIFRSGSAIGAPISATLRYAGRTIDRREPGSTEVGVTVRLEATFSYSLG